MDDGPRDKTEWAVSRAIQVCPEPNHLRRAMIIALIVGTWLTLLNQAGAL